MKTKIPEETIARLLQNSYRNFHAKGLDYVCLQRSPGLTLKVYFFDMDIREATEADVIAEVVNPHDHRYDFATSVIRGGVTNTIWRKVLEGQPGYMAFERYAFRTPLNGGNGFTWEDQDFLMVDNATHYGPGDTYRSLHQTIHTLNNVQPGTILALEQYADQVPLRSPTHTYVRQARWHVRGRAKPPSLSGLYDHFTADAMVVRLQQLDAASPGALAWIKG